MRPKLVVIENTDDQIDRAYQENGYQPIYLIGPGGVKTVLTKKTWKRLLQEASVAYDNKILADDSANKKNSG